MYFDFEVVVSFMITAVKRDVQSSVGSGTLFLSYTFSALGGGLE